MSKDEKSFENASLREEDTLQQIPKFTCRKKSKAKGEGTNLKKKKEKKRKKTFYTFN